MVDRPVEVVDFYRTIWGHQDEFLELFTRNRSGTENSIRPPCGTRGRALREDRAVR